MEIDAENNGSATGMNLLGLIPVVGETSGEGLPYAPENWPEPGDVWGWRTGRRVAQNGHFLDRYLYLPMRLSRSENPNPGSSRKYRVCFPSKLSVERYIKSNFPETDIDAFFASFSWKIPCIHSTQTKGNSEPIVAVPLRQISHTELSASELQSDSCKCKVKNKKCDSEKLKKPEDGLPVMPCDICCAEPGFCRDCCCILCSKTVDSAYGGYNNYIKCQEKIDNNFCGHISHLECALRCHMAGTVGGSIGLDTEYYCRRCDGRTDLIPHVNKLLQICKTIDSRNEIEIILNLGASLLRGSKKAIAKELLNHIELANLKLKYGTCVKDIWVEEEEGKHAAYSLGLAENGYAAMDIDPEESPLNVRGSEFNNEPNELVKLEVEVDQVLQNLRKSQEYEYKLAEERLHAQKNYLNNLYQQLKSERSELARPRSSSSSLVVSDLAIRKREEQIKLETQKLEDMKRVAHGFGSTCHDILREHFGLGIAD